MITPRNHRTNWWNYPERIFRNKELWSGEFRHQSYILHRNSLHDWSLAISIYDSVKIHKRVYMALSRLHRNFLIIPGQSPRISGHRSWWWFLSSYLVRLFLYSVPNSEFCHFSIAFYHPIHHSLYHFSLFHAPSTHLIIFSSHPISYFSPIKSSRIPSHHISTLVKKRGLIWDTLENILSGNMILLAVWEHNALTDRAPIMERTDFASFAVITEGPLPFYPPMPVELILIQTSIVITTASQTTFV